MAAKEDVFELKLFVDGKQLADSTDFNLWQSVYKVIKRAEEKLGDTGNEPCFVEQQLLIDITDEAQETAISKFAKMLGVDVAVLKGACDPKTEAPFIHLDMHLWADWKKNLPKRGPDSVSAIALSGTFLALWFRITHLGTLTLRQSQKVLADIGAEDKNPTRAINNCEWLQERANKRIQLNPSEISKAIEVAKAFCEKRAPKLASK